EREDAVTDKRLGAGAFEQHVERPIFRRQLPTGQVDGTCRSEPGGRSSRSRLMSAMTTVVAPAARAACMDRLPIGPAPVTSTRLPTPTPPFRHAQIPTERGSSNAPASSDNSSGSGNA